MKLQKTTCGRCSTIFLTSNPDRYCISCCMEVKRHTISLKEAEFNTGSGSKMAKRHWHNLPKYVKNDILKRTDIKINGENIQYG